MIISHKYKFVLYTPPKTAGSSIACALSEHCGPEDIITPNPPNDKDETKIEDTCRNDPSSPLVHQHANPFNSPPPSGYLTICPVRNPFDVFVSFSQ